MNKTELKDGTRIYYSLTQKRSLQEMQVGSQGQKIPWRRKWQLTLVFLPGKSHRQRSLQSRVMGSQWVRQDWMTEHVHTSARAHVYIHTHTHTHTHLFKQCLHPILYLTFPFRTPIIHGLDLFILYPYLFILILCSFIFPV